ncbi:MAG TPA: glycosyltransferase, partial [Clostridia bacterium]|nr:glycosyltransferase [Clostridia bacterium]
MSVIVVCHNYASHLPEAVGSVINQTFKDLEIVLVDDGSTDDSLSVAKRLMADHGRKVGFRVVHLNDVGPAAARQYGAGLARGKYLLMLDADDKIAPEFLAKTIPILEANPKLGFVYVDTVFFGDSQQRHQQPEYDFARLCRQNFISYCSPIRKAAFDEIAGYDSENWGYYEDWDLWIRLGSKGWYGQHLAEPLFFYRHHFSSSLSLFSIRLDPVYKAFLVDRHPQLHSPEEVTQARAVLAEMPSGWNSRPPMRDIGQLQQLAERHPHNRFVLYFLGLALWKAGKQQQAEATLTNLLAAFPQDTQARELLGHLAAASKQVSGKERHPLVSVIVPTYNRPDQLVQALRSILNQSFQDFEIVVVNDAGNEIESAVASLGNSDKIVCLRHETNRGLAASRNTGIAAARGKYIAYLDDDDLFYPDHLQTLLDFLQAHPGHVAYTDAHRGHQKLVDGQWKVVQREVPFSHDWDNDKILVDNFVPVLCFMHEKAFLEKSGNFDESLGRHEDWDLWVRLSRHYTFSHIPKVTCEFSFRHDNTSMTGQGFGRFLETMERIHARYASFVQGKPALMQAQRAKREELRRLSSPQAIASKLKVAVLSLDERSTACAYLRWLAPLNYLHAQGALEHISVSDIVSGQLDIDQERLRKARVIVVQRGLAASLPYATLRAAVPDPAVKIVFELDDALTMLPQSHQFFSYFQSVRPRMEEYLRHADLVTVSTP